MAYTRALIDGCKLRVILGEKLFVQALPVEPSRRQASAMPSANRILLSKPVGEEHVHPVNQSTINTLDLP